MRGLKVLEEAETTSVRDATAVGFSINAIRDRGGTTGELPPFLYQIVQYGLPRGLSPAYACPRTCTCTCTYTRIRIDLDAIPSPSGNQGTAEASRTVRKEANRGHFPRWTLA